MKESVKRYFGKLLSFLRVRMIAGGLEISDQVIRLAYFDGAMWQTASVVLDPGVMERGAVKDRDGFLAALAALRERTPMLGKDRKRKMNVIVSLSSASVYIQTFALPILQGEELEKAINLNIQMSSPGDLASSYFGSQVLRRDEEALRLEISAATIEKKLVDDVMKLLFASGFVVIGVESHAFSLVRLAREKSAPSSVDPAKSYLVLDIDDSGIDFLVLRKGQLYFEYATPWRDIADDKGQVTMEKFRSTIIANLRQVSNFYHQHWSDQLQGVILSSGMLREEAAAAAREASTLPVADLAVDMGQAASPEWLGALGAGLRGMKADINDKEVNLSGEGAADAFRREQVLNFLDMWQLLVPAILCVLIVTLVVADNFLGSMERQLAATALAGQRGAPAGLASFEASSTAFNDQVTLALAVQAHEDKNHLIFGELASTAKANSVQISHFTFRGTSISLSGIAHNENDIVSFKNSIEADPNFGPVNLPLSGIQPSLSAYSFSMTFSLSPSAFK